MRKTEICRRRKIKSSYKAMNNLKDFFEKEINSYEKVLELCNELHKDFEEDKKKTFDGAEKVLKIFKEKSLDKKNIFTKARFIPDENNLSDALAYLFDPNEGHQLGTLALKVLLESVENKSIIIENRCINCYREVKETNTRLDIEITGDKFIIFIENKVWGGSETVIDNEPQTEREWKALERKMEEKNISNKNCVAVFLSPDGKKPANKYFKNLRVDKFVSNLINKVKEIKPESNDVIAFLDFYHYNY